MFNRRMEVVFGPAMNPVLENDIKIRRGGKAPFRPPAPSPCLLPFYRPTTINGAQ